MDDGLVLDAVQAYNELIAADANMPHDAAGDELMATHLTASTDAQLASVVIDGAAKHGRVQTAIGVLLHHHMSPPPGPA